MIYEDKKNKLDSHELTIMPIGTNIYIIRIDL